MTSRFQEPRLDHEQYATLVDEAFIAFSLDVNYLINILESARSLSQKKRSTSTKLTLKE